jgi:hypothetical protein
VAQLGDIFDAVSEISQAANEEVEGQVLTKVLVITEWTDSQGRRSLFDTNMSADHKRLKSWETIGLLTSILSQYLNRSPGGPRS